MNRIEPYGFFIIIGLVLLVPAFSTFLGNLDVSVCHFLIPGA